MQQRNQNLDEFDDLKNRIGEASATVESHNDELVNTLYNVESQIAAKTSYQITDVLDALSHVAVLLNLESVSRRKLSCHFHTLTHVKEAIFAVGDLLSGGESISKFVIASFDQLKTPSGGEINKSYLYDKIEMIRDDTKTSLQDTVHQDYHEALKQTSSYLAEIKVESSKFDKMVDEHDLMKIPGGSKA